MKKLSTRNRRRLTNLIVYPVCIAGMWWADYISHHVPEPYVEDFPVTPGIVQSYCEAGEQVVKGDNITIDTAQWYINPCNLNHSRIPNFVKR